MFELGDKAFLVMRAENRRIFKVVIVAKLSEISQGEIKTKYRPSSPHVQRGVLTSFVENLSLYPEEQFFKTRGEAEHYIEEMTKPRPIVEEDWT